MLCSGLLAGPALAASLDDAKAEGQVGERIDGYLGMWSPIPRARCASWSTRSTPTPREVRARSLRSSGAPLAAVAKITGKKQIERTPAGQYVAGADGHWRRK